MAHSLKTWPAFSPLARSLACVSLGFLVIAFGGCGLPDRPDIELLRKAAPWEDPSGSTTRVGNGANGNASRTSSGGLASLVSVVAPPPPFPTDWQSHELRFLNEDIVGTNQIVSQSTENEQILVSVAQQTLRRAGAASWIDMTEQRMLHDKDGTLMRIDSRWRNGPMRREQVLRINKDQAEFENRFAGSSVSAQLALPENLDSPLIVYQSLLRQPMQPRQRREFNVVIPAVARLAHLTVECTGPAAITGLIPIDEPVQEIRVLSQIGEGPTRTMFHWFDDKGQIKKSNVAGERESSYLCTPEQFASMGSVILDQTHPLTFRIAGKALPVGTIQRIGLEVKHPMIAESTTDASGTTIANTILPTAPGQYVQRVDSQTLRVVVSEQPLPQNKVAGRFDVFNQRPNEQDIAATAIVNFQTPQVQRLQKNLAIDGLLADELAAEANRLVHSLLEYQPLSEGIRSASQIADSSVADSTEQSILLMALLRSNNIPCRLMLGLRHDPSVTAKKNDVADEVQFVFHSWVIAYTKDQWMTLDPVTGDQAGADRLAIQTANIQDANPEAWMRNYLAALVPLNIKLFAATARP